MLNVKRLKGVSIIVLNPRALLNQSPWQTYTYGNSSWGDLLTEYNGQTISYDTIGNPTTYRDGITMTWQNGRELATLSDSTKSIAYTYDPEGLRTKKAITSSTGTTTNVEYVYEGGLLMQMKYGERIFDFSYDTNGNPIGFKYTIPSASVSSYYYYGLNSRGDVDALYTSSGSISALYEYDAYGKLLSVKNSSGKEITGDYSIAHLNPLRYRGYVYDTETGLYYLQSRYYDPTTCRFINADSYCETGQGINGYNMFAYCNNNPVIFADYLGTNAMIIYDSENYGHIGALIEDDNGVWYHFYYGAPKWSSFFSLFSYVTPETWCVEYTGNLDINAINATGQYQGTYDDSVLLYGDFSISLIYIELLEPSYNAFNHNCSQYTFEALSLVDNYNSDLLKESSDVSYDPHVSYQHFKANAIDFRSDTYKINHILTVKEKRLCKM